MSIIKLIARCLLICLVGCSEPVYDIVILGGTVYEGLGDTPKVMDVGIIDESIAKVGDLSGASAKATLEVTGMVVSPGFIDLHAHLEPLMRLPAAENHIRQGITTALGGPDGGGPWPFSQYLDSLDQMELGYNVAYLAGHNNIRREVMGLENRAPTRDELEAMKLLVASCMESGAFGISTGLKYLPGAFSEIGEVIALSKVASTHGGIYTSHLREEGLGLIEGVQEAIRIAEEADIPVVLTHHKVVGQPMWGASKRTLSLVDSARVAGLDVMIDQYPYTASFTSISILIPAWARAGGQEEFIRRMNDPVLADSIKQGTIFNIINDRGGNDLHRVQFARVPWDRSLEGKTLAYWAKQRNLEKTPENGADLVLEAQLNGGCQAIFHAMDDQDVERIMAHPQTMIASDGRLVAFGDSHPHPRWYGTFPRVLGHYVREKKVLNLAEAIKKMTSMPAARLGLVDRGVIKEGMKADLVVFDPDKIIDKATFIEPHQYPEGIDYVIINGQLAVDQGRLTGERAGSLLRKE